MKKTRGFTLVELLAVMVILAVIAVIVFPTIEDYVTGSKDNAYQNQIHNIEAAAKNWAADHPEKIPDEGGKYTVTLSELQSGNYIESVTNPKTDTPFSGTTSIEISNQSGSYIYKVTLR